MDSFDQLLLEENHRKMWYCKKARRLIYRLGTLPPVTQRNRPVQVTLAWHIARVNQIQGELVAHKRRILNRNPDEKIDWSRSFNWHGTQTGRISFH